MKNFIYLNDLPPASPFRQIRLKDIPGLEIRSIHNTTWKKISTWNIAEKSFNSLSDNWKIHYEFRFLPREDLSFPAEAIIAIVLFSLILFLSFLLSLYSSYHVD